MSLLKVGHARLAGAASVTQASPKKERSVEFVNASEAVAEWALEGEVTEAAVK